ncbi:MAG: hypothetical protein DMG05_11395 [Acidobacteria bacterium]|nr:MAG: hypothetical protein DMG05_11395 [Acidobacteriota bacterium]
MPGRILIIDPDEDQITELRFMLEGQGYSIETARDGLEGLEKGKLFQPDLVITELLLDRLSGFEVSSRIAADAEFQAPVIFYTGFYRDEYARKEVTSKYGAVDYFIKPFQREALTKAVAGILSQREVATEVVAQRTGSSALDGSKEEKARSREPAGETEVRATPEPADNSESRLEETVTTQQSSPVSAMDEAARLPEKDQGTIIATAETVSAQPAAPQPEVRPAASQLVPAASNELNILSSAQKSPAASPIYRSRPLQIVVIMILLFLVFFWLKGRIPFFEKKRDYMTLEVQEESTAVQPSSQTGSTPSTANGVPSPGSNQEPAKQTTAPATPSSPPDDRNLPPDALSESSTSVPLHTRETRSARHALPREVRSPRAGRAANLVIHDVTGAGKLPFLKKSRRPVLSPEVIQADSTQLVVIRIVISQEGKVLEAAPVNQDESNASLSQAALRAVQDWEFKPIRKGDEKTWTKYFSFKLAQGSD